MDLFPRDISLSEWLGFSHAAVCCSRPKQGRGKRGMYCPVLCYTGVLPAVSADAAHRMHALLGAAAAAAADALAVAAAALHPRFDALGAPTGAHGRVLDATISTTGSHVRAHARHTASSFFATRQGASDSAQKILVTPHWQATRG